MGRGLSLLACGLIGVVCFLLGYILAMHDGIGGPASSGRAGQVASVPEIVGPFTVFVYKRGDYAIAVDQHWRVIANSSDHAAVIWRALEYLVEVGGGRLVFGEGVYKISRTIEVKGDVDIIIEGAAILHATRPNITILKICASGFEAGYRLRTIIRGLKFTREPHAVNVTAIHIVARTAPVVAECYFIDVGYAIVLEGAEGGFITNNNIYAKRYGIYLKHADVQIIGNRIGYGIKGICARSGGQIIMNNEIWNMAEAGIEIYGDKNQIIGNHIEDTRYAIRLSGHWNVISGNRIGHLRKGGVCIYIGPSGEWTMIANNWLMSAETGIRLESDSHRVVITGNVFSGLMVGIVFNAGDKHTLVVGNIFHEVKTPFTGARLEYIPRSNFVGNSGVERAGESSQ